MLALNLELINDDMMSSSMGMVIRTSELQTLLISNNKTRLAEIKGIITLSYGLMIYICFNLLLWYFFSIIRF